MSEELYPDGKEMPVSHLRQCQVVISSGQLWKSGQYIRIMHLILVRIKPLHQTRASQNCVSLMSVHMCVDILLALALPVSIIFCEFGFVLLVNTINCKLGWTSSSCL